MTDKSGASVSATTSPLEPRHYTDDRWYALEQAWLRDHCWHFVCLKREIDRPNGYATVDVAGASITVENTRAGPIAFRNVCSHRGARLRDLRIGAGPLVCPYHGWHYDDGGVPSRIPFNDTAFGFSEAERAALALPRYRLEMCGEFIFVAVPGIDVGLADYLGASVSILLADLSAALEGEIAVEVIEATANWKVLIENAMDPLHSPFMHRTTFGAIATIDVDNQTHGAHSSYLTKMQPEYLERFRRLERFVENRPFKVDGYLHLHVFPNLSIGTNMGLTCMVQTLEPRQVDKTSLVNRYADMRLIGKEERKGPQIDAIRRMASQFNATIGEEDRSVAERVQRGLGDLAAPRPVLGNRELRIGHFQAVCARFMDAATRVRDSGLS